MDKKYESSGTANLAGIINQRYYSGKLREEISKAKAYADESGVSDIGGGIDYNKIYEKIPYKSGDYEPQYSAKEGLITTFREEDLQKRIQNWKNFVKEEPQEAEKYAIGNGFESARDLTGALQNPDYYRSVLEHEYGHPYSRSLSYSKGGVDEDLYSAKKPSYMAEPAELANGLGRIQRETYQMTGRRFEDPNELKAFVETTPFESATEGYSDEAKRTWRVLYENKGVDAEQGSPLPLLQWSSMIAPALVQVNKKFNTAT